MDVRKISRYLRDRRFRYEPLAEITLSKSNLLSNFKTLQAISPGKTIAPVLKSNAYGHGLVQIAKILEEIKNKGPLLVDSYYEALTLRNEGITSPILVIGYTLPINIEQSVLSDTTFTIHDIHTLEEIASLLTSKKPFHIKIDTGMHRQGFQEAELEKALSIIRQHENIFVEGIYSHPAGTNETETRKQIDAWNRIAKSLRKEITSLKWFHLSATYGIQFQKDIEANMIRSGIALYGIKTKLEKELKPVLEFRSLVSSIKKIEKGEKVGYEGTFEAPETMTLGTIPVGYFEGVDLRLSNKGYVKVKNHFAKIIGRVSMNITTIDLSKIGVTGGEWVSVISRNPEDENSVEKIAKICGTIPWEILVHIPVGIRRSIVE